MLHSLVDLGTPGREGAVAAAYGSHGAAADAVLPTLVIVLKLT